ncbi:nitrilase-related carbon-nitrogen hydrolase [Thermococcus sp.]|uniref:nitrilase-related carbon-nitrogen hydrolase n=1 Tax=Thermococcus sp. TaxID=35749 RepID=UPI0019A000A3|nr:nitrilase-related carbon-nitrogen hydrolase [Thermococcus sp.]MBC7094448.1 carbon-nitrogen hydrolase [Thermococcus sp.]
MKAGIGLVQMSPEIGKKQKNLEKATNLIYEAISQGADIVALPELFITGYDLDTIGKDLHKLAETQNGETIKQLAEIARKENVYIIAPIPEIRDSKIYNSAVMIGNKGDVLGVYSKTHLWLKEKDYFTPGNTFPVFKTEYGNIGIMICYDAGFPEVARILTLKGADIIVLPAAWRVQDFDIWDLNTRSRALENSVYLAATNMVGELCGDPQHFFGNARIVGPRGEILAAGSMFEEEVITKKVNLERITKIRAEIQYLNDRRPELYKKVALF